MCGISGLFIAGELPRISVTRTVRAMTAAMEHRGPDDDGFFFDGRVGLGMRRLSIIDLSGGKQPICNEDGSIVVVLNGEIYNFKDLQGELVSLGHQFRTHSDTEVETDGPGLQARPAGPERKTRRLNTMYVSTS